MASANTVVEVGRLADQQVDQRLVQRLVALELSDVEVPPPAAAATSSEAPGLYVRIIADDKKITVELWDRGELQGLRRLSLQGSQPLRARRIALASGVLVRQLRERRLFENEEHEQKLAAERERLSRPKPPTIEARPFISGAVAGAWVQRGDGVLLGPRMAVGLRFSGGGEIALGAGLGAGAVTAADESPRIQWHELSVHPGYALELDAQHALRFGAGAAVAALHVGGGRLADEVAETWTARAVGEFAWRVGLSEHVALSTNVEAGAMLRRVALLDDQHLGGLWLGLSTGVVLE